MGSRKKPLTNKAGEVRELTEDDFATAMRFSDLPSEVQQVLRSVNKRGRPKVVNPKRTQTFKLSPDVIDGIRASGKGYNARVEAVLRSAILEGRI